MNILHRVWDSLGFSDRFDDMPYDYDYDEEGSPEFYGQESAYPVDQRLPVNNNVVGLPSRQGSQEILLLEPRSFEEMPQTVSALKQRKSVILNLGLMDPDMAQRCVDFVAGGAFAIDGHQERLGENIFLFTPNYVQISNQALRSPQPAQPPASSASRVMPPPTITWSNERPRM